MAVQKAKGYLFGEAAVELGLVTPEELRRALAEQVAYPYIERGKSRLHTELVAAYEPFGRASESIRDLRSQLLIRYLSDVRKVVAVTSPRSPHGSSSVAANLAITFSQLGERVLLIDANMRSPRQHELFGINNGIGLSAVLSGRAAINDAMTSIPGFEHLFVMSAGPAPLNPQELLARVMFSYLVETGPAAFDVLVVDTPPLLQFADALRAIQLAHGCILAVRRDETLVTDIKTSQTQIAAAGANLIGAVIVS